MRTIRESVLESSTLHGGKARRIFQENVESNIRECGRVDSYHRVGTSVQFGCYASNVRDDGVPRRIERCRSAGTSIRK